MPDQRSECSVDGCDSRRLSLGLCMMHYTRMRRHGSVDGLSPRRLAPEGASIMRRLLAGIVDDTDCWLWGRGLSSTGYPHLWLAERGGKRGAHILMWEQYHGRSVPKGMYVCHSCDVPACINPAHLWLGTPRDNSLDMWAKGRGHTPTVPKKGAVA